MFHFLSPRVATGTCYVSFSVSTCSHRHMLCFIFCLHLQAHALFHLLSPLAATRTCFVSFAVSTCRHRHMLCFICCLHLQPHAHALFHLLSPLADTGTCYVSFAVSTCSHRHMLYFICCLHLQPQAEHSWFPGFSWTVAVCPRCGQHLGWWAWSCLLLLFNPFTVPACKISVLKHSSANSNSNYFIVRYT